MKYKAIDMACLFGTVVPRVGTWIEIIKPPSVDIRKGVVPRVGTWIEIRLPLPTGRAAKRRASCRHVD